MYRKEIYMPFLHVLKNMNIASDWKDYEILDMANGEKLERWGNVFLVRPDPQIIWKDKSYPQKWKKVNANRIIVNKGEKQSVKLGLGNFKYKLYPIKKEEIDNKDLQKVIKVAGIRADRAVSAKAHSLSSRL